ncbi:MAG: hypothetical protein ACREXW_01005 [Gammaproteobacteria bacterium]
MAEWSGTFDTDRDEPEMLEAIHVTPMFGREHLVNVDGVCWCHRTYVLYCEAMVIVHNVMH